MARASCSAVRCASSKVLARRTSKVTAHFSLSGCLASVRLSVVYVSDCLFICLPVFPSVRLSVGPSWCAVVGRGLLPWRPQMCVNMGRDFLLTLRLSLPARQSALNPYPFPSSPHVVSARQSAHNSNPFPSSPHVVSARQSAPWCARVQLSTLRVQVHRPQPLRGTRGDAHR